MQSVKLLSLLACVLSLLSIAVAQCPPSAIVCAVGNCCNKYYDCYNGAVHNELERPMSAGTNCKNNMIVSAAECGACQPFTQENKPTTRPAAEATTKPVQPTQAPTKAPQPTQAPTKAPQPTQAPTKAPTQPTQAPTKAPTQPTQAPTKAPQPTQAPTKAPQPTQAPTKAPTQPTQAPVQPTQAPTVKAPTKGECVAIPNRGASDAWCKAVQCDPAYVEYCTTSPVAPPVQATTKPVDGSSTKAPISITQAPTQPASNPGCKLSDVFTEQDYKVLFPYANGAAKNGINNQHAIFNYSYLLQAAARYPEFACEGDLATRKREVAAFLAHASQESSGWWAGQPYNWGFYFSTEVGCDAAKCQQYCSPSSEYPCQPGQGYFGRGPIQLSWNYNYGMVSQELFGNDKLLKNPDAIFEQGGTAFLTALWFWMAPQNPKPSCHDVMIGAWTPSQSDLNAGRKPGFGMTVNIINGGIECGHTTPQQVLNRVGYYNVYANHFGVSTGSDVTCDKMYSY